MGICILKHTAEHWTYSALQYWELYFNRFVSALKLVYFLDLLGFFKCIFLFVNKTKFVQVLRIYVNLSKSYKNFVTGKLIYFWKQGG